MDIQQWLAVFAAAKAISDELFGTVHDFAVKTLSPTELADLHAAWQGDVEESARNAGIDPEPDTPLV